MSSENEEDKKVSATGQNTQSNASIGKSLKISPALVVLLVGALAFVTLKEPQPIRLFINYSTS